MERRITPQEWDEWARHPLTLAFRKELQATVAASKDKWALAYYTGDTAEETLRLNTVAIAGVDMLQQVCEQIDEKKLELNDE